MKMSLKIPKTFISEDKIFRWQIEVTKYVSNKNGNVKWVTEDRWQKRLSIWWELTYQSTSSGLTEAGRGDR